MGVTKQGKVAVLTNYRENTPDQATGIHSRGAIVNSWLTTHPDHKRTTKDFVEELISSNISKRVGGFSLICGHVNEPLAIVSNRSAEIDKMTWVATEKGQTIGLSNTAFEDRTWPKIIEGEKLLKGAIEAHVQAKENEDQLIDRLLEVLSTDSLPRLSEGATTETYLKLLRKSIFIPAIGAQDECDRAADEVAAARDEDKVPVATSARPDTVGQQTYMRGAYGTQKQTVILVRDNGRVRYFERTLYDNYVNAIPPGKGDRSFEFMVEK